MHIMPVNLSNYARPGNRKCSSERGQKQSDLAISHDRNEIKSILRSFIPSANENSKPLSPRQDLISIAKTNEALRIETLIA
jgi:hypothetical protein